MYFHARRVSIQLDCIRNPALVRWRVLAVSVAATARAGPTGGSPRCTTIPAKANRSGDVRGDIRWGEPGIRRKTEKVA